MNSDAKKVVAVGYDAIAETYLRWTSDSPLRQQWLNTIVSALPTHARVLDLGCGAGIPVAQKLANHGCRVVGVDGSQRQIALACENEPRGTFIVADMTAVEFEPMSFDAVTAFYSITHVPRHEHPILLNKIRTWLKPGGIFLASMGYGDCLAWTGDWLGTTMFFSHFDAATNRRLIEDAGLNIERAEVIGEEEFGDIVRFLWVVARRSRSCASA
jgi:SAM-dependent methyltransferase